MEINWAIAKKKTLWHYEDLIEKMLDVIDNLDILEKCRTRKNRSQISKETGMKKSFVLELTHRADMSRLAYVRGKTIKHLCGGG